MNLYANLLSATADIGSSMDYSQPIAERFGQGITTLLFGMLVVFASLCIIWGILELFRIFSTKPNKKTKADINTNNKVETVVEKAPENKTNDEELVAAITAAISVYLANESGSTVAPAFRVVSFKKH